MSFDPHAPNADPAIPVNTPTPLNGQVVITFRDWLRANEDDRERYAAAKRELAQRHWETMSEYANAKDAIVAEIHARIEAAR